MGVRGVAAAAVVVSLAITVPSAAQELELHGFVQGNYSVRTAGTRETDPRDDFLLGDHRLQLELEQASDSGAVSFLVKVDFFHDAVAGQADIDVREAYLTLEGSQADLRIGRQIITWGVGDLVFINDVFTKDWTALIAGQPLQYLKLGSDGANANFYLGALSAQIIAIPFFEPDRLPTGDRLVAFDPLPGVPKQTRIPDRTVEDTELAGRLSGYVAGFDTAFYVYRGFWRAPPGLEIDTGSSAAGGRATGATWFYPPLSVYGASAQGSFATGVLSTEFGFYDSRQDREGTDPGIENSQARILVGYQKPLTDELTLSGQYYHERMLNGDAYRASLPPGFAARSTARHNITGRLTRYFNYQTYQVSLFVWVSPNDEDYWVNPELRYTVSDEMWIAAGANVFGGSGDHTFFGQFNRNDNVYTTLRFTF